MRQQEPYIAAGTLSEAISDDAPEHVVHSDDADIDGHAVTLAAVRA